MSPRPLEHARRRLARWSPMVALLTSLLLTAAATAGVARTTHAQDQARWTSSVESAADRIRGRLELYSSLLVGARALFASGGEIDRQDFRRYAQQLNLSKRYPGIQGIGFASRTALDERGPLVAELAREGLTDFHVWPEPDRREGGETFPIVLLEPHDTSNRGALGFDMYSEPVRQRAMASARDTGHPTASHKVRLVQEPATNRQSGFLLYIPIYRGGGVPSTMAERRERLLGFVFAPFRAGDLFQGIFGSERHPGVAFDVYAAGPPSEETLLYQHRGEDAEGLGAFQSTVHLDVGGVPWTIAFRSTDDFERRSSRWVVPLMAGIGALASLALYFVARAQAMARLRAEVLASDLVRAVRIRDDFLSIAGHELRTPLTALTLQLQGLRRQLARDASGRQPERLDERLGRAAAHADRLGQLVEELLDVSRITSGRMHLSPEPVDLGVIIDEVLARNAEELSRARCSVSVTRAGDLKGRWDRLRLEQIVENLLTNAMKYGAGHPIAVRAHAVSDEGPVQLTVSDEGIGISPDDVERIFGRFERAVSDRNYGGLGLGLFITRQIVEAHGGRISLESAPGRGSTFTVELPRDFHV